MIYSGIGRSVLCPWLNVYNWLLSCSIVFIPCQSYYKLKIVWSFLISRCVEILPLCLIWTFPLKWGFIKTLFRCWQCINLFWLLWKFPRFPGRLPLLKPPRKPWLPWKKFLFGRFCSTKNNFINTSYCHRIQKYLFVEQFVHLKIYLADIFLLPQW